MQECILTDNKQSAEQNTTAQSYIQVIGPALWSHSVATNKQKGNKTGPFRILSTEMKLHAV